MTSLDNEVRLCLALLNLSSSQVPLHFLTDPKRVEVTFEGSKRQLRIRLPFRPYRELFEVRAPWSWFLVES